MRSHHVIFFRLVYIERVSYLDIMLRLYYSRFTSLGVSCNIVMGERMIYFSNLSLLFTMSMFMGFGSDYVELVCLASFSNVL